MGTALHCLKTIYGQKVMDFEDHTDTIFEMGEQGLKISNYIECFCRDDETLGIAIRVLRESNSPAVN
uniref:Uncharacterized protein n=1 Tax=Rhizophora mucronata TaxID=61149 RepID=A0A2P2IIN4_RHIMU